METLGDWFKVLWPFAALIALLVVSNVRELRQADKLYQSIEQGLLDEVKAMLAKHSFPSRRTDVVAKSIVRAVEARQPAILEFLLSTDLKLHTWSQKLGSFLYEQSLKGGWRGTLLWRSQQGYPFVPWRDLSEKDKARLRNKASRANPLEPVKVQLRRDVGKWTVP
ncbi:hypothetical protein [Myxococcus landrumensis]|uniref:Uncharacterized protein n=1 Tax=Myxococcus landrumensis TaxID=2813577 RepID=A0ABX7N618_9BACT|nr:hypothetical protein [Myxococcus landrumus]QSQ14186.1 hypothetical protein JY572_38750 [Myxococcus landrumus]